MRQTQEKAKGNTSVEGGKKIKKYSWGGKVTSEKRKKREVLGGIQIPNRRMNNQSPCKACVEKVTTPERIRRIMSKGRLK